MWRERLAVRYTPDLSGRAPGTQGGEFWTLILVGEDWPADLDHLTNRAPHLLWSRRRISP